MARTERISHINSMGQIRRRLQPRGSIAGRVSDESAEPGPVDGAHRDAAGRVPLRVIEGLVGAIDEGSRHLSIAGIGRNSA